jgi:cytolysin (calcineurin-like family phosphatase)
MHTCRHRLAPVFMAALFAASAAHAETFFVNNCLNGKVWDAALCYTRCKPGYAGVGPVCWGSCPDGYHDDGALCRRNAKIISADNSACPLYDKCGLTLKKGCSKCPDGYKNDGCTCRIDVSIKAKASYGRGVGETPFKTCTANSFAKPVPAGNTPSSFTLLFMGDPQLPRFKGSSNDPASSTRVNAEQVNALNSVLQANGGKWPTSPSLTQGGGAPIEKPQGLVVAGDLTEYWHDSETDMFMDYWGNVDPSKVPNFQLPVFLGLGNHDYANNVNDCWWAKRGRAIDGANGCAKNAVGFIKAMISCNMVPNFPASLVQSFDVSSLAYSWNIGKYHFVQLNNYPSYANATIGVSSAIDWLKKDLAAAKAAVKRSILVYHDSDEHWSKDFPAFQQAIAGQNVAAIFVGHYHELVGRADQDGPYHADTKTVSSAGMRVTYNVPIFFSGNPMWNTFLLVRFTDSYMNVATMDSTGGRPSFKCTAEKSCLQTIVF